MSTSDPNSGKHTVLQILIIKRDSLLDDNYYLAETDFLPIFPKIDMHIRQILSVNYGGGAIASSNDNG